MKNEKEQKNSLANEQGFVLIALIIGLLILSLLYLYSIRKVQNQVQRSSDETIDTTLQNPQKTVDDVRNRVNEQFQNEQQKLNDAEKQMNK
jgi:Tfp pilus assembly protein PilE